MCLSLFSAQLISPIGHVSPPPPPSPLSFRYRFQLRPHSLTKRAHIAPAAANKACFLLPSPFTFSGKAKEGRDGTFSSTREEEGGIVLVPGKKKNQGFPTAQKNAKAFIPAKHTDTPHFPWHNFFFYKKKTAVENMGYLSTRFLPSLACGVSQAMWK